MTFGLEKVERDDVHETVGVAAAFKFLENSRRSLLCVGHATTIGDGAKRVTGLDVGDEVAFTETIKSGSRVNDDATGDEDALSLGLVQLDGWADKLEELYAWDDERTGGCIMSFLFAFYAFDVSADIVGWFPGWR